MPKAVWNNIVIAESDKVEVVEGNYYFPRESVKTAYLKESDHHTTCPWKGLAHYYHVVVDDKINENAGWYYPDPKPAANQIKNHIAFWKGIEIKK